MMQSGNIYEFLTSKLSVAVADGKKKIYIICVYCNNKRKMSFSSQPFFETETSMTIHRDFPESIYSGVDLNQWTGISLFPN